MAIFHLHHSFIGRSTHRPGAAAGFAKYITRPEACRKIIGERAPITRDELVMWLNNEEQSDRRNARVIDKVVVAMPEEFTKEQNEALIQSYCERMTSGRASWVAAFHDGPGDEDNPHAHIIFRDRDFDTGKRVMMTSEPGSTQHFRQGWEEEVNLALERHGFEQRVDARSLEAQGINREPEIHVGAGALRLAAMNYDFTSAPHAVERRDGAVIINYPVIDDGRSRFDENEARKERNRLRAIDNGAYPYAWTTDASMPSQQEAATLWNEIAQKRMDGLALTEADRAAAMAWVHASADRAEALADAAYNQGLKPDIDGYDLNEVYGHMDQRKLDRSFKESAREAGERRGARWEAQMSEITRGLHEDDMQRGRDGRAHGLER